MPESIYLHGSEDIARGGQRMVNAASEMSTAASQIDFTFQQHQTFLTEWLDRFEKILNQNQKKL